MDTLILELFDLTISQALIEVRNALQKHTGRIRILLPLDEMLRINLERLIEREGRNGNTQQVGSVFQMDLPVTHRLAAPPLPPPPPPPVPIRTPLPAPMLPADMAAPKHFLLLHSAFSPGERALGRQLLLGVLEQIHASDPTLTLAHAALELLEDPRAMEILLDLQAKGAKIQVSSGSLRYHGIQACPFALVEDDVWQKILAQGMLQIL